MQLVVSSSGGHFSFLQSHAIKGSGGGGGAVGGKGQDGGFALNRAWGVLPAEHPSSDGNSWEDKSLAGRRKRGRRRREGKTLSRDP